MMSRRGFDDMANALEMLVDARVGVIATLQEAPREAGDPDFFHVAGRAANTAAFGRHANFRGTGGAAANRGGALVKAAGEAVERYCAALFDVEDLPLTSAAEADFLCVDPREFALYTREQLSEKDFTFVDFTSDTLVRWLPALDWATDRLVWVPAASIFVPYVYYQSTGDQPIMQPISTGLACHSSLAEAAISAICEVIERDAVTITWQAMLSLPHIDLNSISEANHDLVARFERTRGLVTLLDLRLDIDVPIVMAALRADPDVSPVVVVAASCDPDPEAAVRKSLEELEHTRHYAQFMKTYVPRLVGGPEAVTEQQDHLNYWCDSAHAEEADFLFASQARISFQDLPSLRRSTSAMTLDAVAEQVLGVGERLLLADITTRDIRETGLAVVRAVLPGLHPLFMGHKHRALGGRRLWEVPAQRGLAGRPFPNDNPAPHPYP